MHESHLVADLMARVESEIDPIRVRVSRLDLQVGELSALSPTAVKEGIERRAKLTWGYTPQVVVDASPDIDGTGAMGVTLTSIKLVD
jgi:Zn finger protein HypA/HybF involved in hydrogenase expression